MLVFFDNVHLTFCRIGLQMPLRRWDIVIFWCAVHCWGVEILWASGCVSQCWRGWNIVIFWCVVHCWRGWDLVSFWVCSTMLERARSCDLLVCGTLLERIRSCELLGVWHNVGEGGILWSSGCVGPCWRGWDLVIFGVRYNVEEGEILWSSGCVGPCWRGWDLVIFWVCGNMLGRVISCDLLRVWDHLGGVWHCDLLGVWHHVGEREEKLRLDRTSFLYRPLANFTDNK